MKVLLVSSLERGGPVEQSIVLARGLHERSAEVTVLCGTEAIAERLRSVGVAAEVLVQRPGVDLAAGRAIWRRMRGADVVHAQDRRSGLWVRLAPRPGRAARVYTVHGLPEPYLPPPIGAERPTWRDRLAYEGLDAALCRRAEVVIVPSRALAEQFARRLRFPPDRLSVVPNGVELPARRLARGAEVGTLSLLEPVKDIATFLAAAARLAAGRPEARFVVFGDGPERARLQAQALRLGLGGRVRFPGHTPRDAALSQLGVLVVSSIMENAPMAMLEAMAAGVPVVASRTGGIPELAGPDGAQLVAPGDAAGFAAAVEALLADPARADQQAAAARRRVAEHFSLAANAEATLAAYALARSRRVG